LSKVAILKRTGHDHHRHTAGADIGLQRTQDLKPTQSEQFEIQQDDLRHVWIRAIRVGSFTKKEFERDSSILEMQNTNVWVFLSESTHRKLRIVKIILNQQDINLITLRS